MSRTRPSIHITLEEHVNDFEVWVSMQPPGPDLGLALMAESFIIATGRTKGDALLGAAKELTAAMHVISALMGERNMDTTETPREALRAELETTIVETGNRLLPYFRFAHLPPKLAHRSAGFARLAIDLVRDSETKDPAELTVALRKLLEGKDAAVRSTL